MGASTASGNKKRMGGTTFSRFLRGLKTSHRKEKHGGSSSPRHGRAAGGTLLARRADTPDSVLRSTLGPQHTQHQVLRSMVDPRDYDRLIGIAQLNHINSGGSIISNSFEETIYRVRNFIIHYF